MKYIITVDIQILYKSKDIITLLTALFILHCISYTSNIYAFFGRFVADTYCYWNSISDLDVLFEFHRSFGTKQKKVSFLRAHFSQQVLTTSVSTISLSEFFENKLYYYLKPTDSSAPRFIVLFHIVGDFCLTLTNTKLTFWKFILEMKIITPIILPRFPTTSEMFSLKMAR